MPGARKWSDPNIRQLWIAQKHAWLSTPVPPSGCKSCEASAAVRLPPVYCDGSLQADSLQLLLQNWTVRLGRCRHLFEWGLEPPRPAPATSYHLARNSYFAPAIFKSTACRISWQLSLESQAEIQAITPKPCLIECNNAMKGDSCRADILSSVKSQAWIAIRKLCGYQFSENNIWLPVKWLPSN